MKKDPKYFTDDDRALIHKWDSSGMLAKIEDDSLKLFIAQHYEIAGEYGAKLYKIQYGQYRMTYIFPCIRRIICKLEVDEKFIEQTPDYKIDIASLINDLNKKFDMAFESFKNAFDDSLDCESEFLVIFSDYFRIKTKKLYLSRNKEYINQLLIEKVSY